MFTHIYCTCSRLFAELLGKVQVTADGVHGHVRLQEGRGMASDISQISQVQTGWIGRSHDSEWFLQIGNWFGCSIDSLKCVLLLPFSLVNFVYLGAKLVTCQVMPFGAAAATGLLQFSWETRSSKYQ